MASDSTNRTTRPLLPVMRESRIVNTKEKLSEFYRRMEKVTENLTYVNEPIDLIGPLSERESVRLHAIMPPIEAPEFLAIPNKLINENNIKSFVVGDILFAQIKEKTSCGLALTLIAFDVPKRRVLNVHEDTIDVNCPLAHLNDPVECFEVDIYIRVVIKDLIHLDVDGEKNGEKKLEIVTSMLPQHLSPDRDSESTKLGILKKQEDDLPLHVFVPTIESDHEMTYSNVLHSSEGFYNLQSTEHLIRKLGIQDPARYSFYGGSLERFDVLKDETAEHLRDLQSTTWAKPHIAVGQRRMQSEAYFLAMQSFDKAIEICPNSCEAYIARAQLHSKMDNWSRALDDFKRAHKLDKDKKADAAGLLADHLFNYGKQLQADGAYKQALLCFDKVLIYNGDHNGARTLRRICNDQANRVNT